MILRSPVVAGSFYPENPEQLRCEVESYLQGARLLAEVDMRPAALVVPHAGYYFSAAVAADAYRLIADEVFDLVVVLAPSHRHYFVGASIYSIGNYATPLGEVEVDSELADGLIANYPEIDFVPEAHRFEHSLEVQLPFLQVSLGKFKLLPIVLGQQSWGQAETLAEIVADLALSRRLLLIASTDLSHFHDAATAKLLDRQVVDAVAAFDPQAFWSLIENRQAEACGAGPLLTVMLAAKKMRLERTKVLHYRHSGEVSGDNERVVGYLSAAIY
ncbi:AmmeMemoRadiSam system protein B [bacterium]|nr:AmmeMemoRadiSam system protein B [bacterium]